MSIKLDGNTHVKQGGEIIFIPDECEYLMGGKVLDVVKCKIFMSTDDRERQINKTLYEVFLRGGVMSISGDSVKIEDSVIYCSGNLEDYAKALAAYCRLICGKEQFRASKL
jgi:hypothetical protein